MNDFSGAKSRADALDASILSAAGTISSEYADIVSLSLRQVIGATELTIREDADGSWNTTDFMMFMKNLGGGNARSVNRVLFIET